MAFLFARQVTMAEIGHTPYFKMQNLLGFDDTAPQSP